MPFLKIAGSEIHFYLRRSKRAKRLQMIVRKPFFEVIAPKRVKNLEIIQFVCQHQGWMQKQVSRKQKITFTSNLTWPAEFLSNEIIYFRHEPLILNVKFGKKAFIAKHNNELIITVPWHKTQVTSLGVTTQKQIIQWYRQEANKFIETCIQHYCPQLDRWPKSVTLKQQKTRWGSCGADHKIYINWLLVLAPPGVLEYVVVHELCHLFYRNHGVRFWAKVEKCMPEYEKYEAWLRGQGASLQIVR